MAFREVVVEDQVAKGDFRQFTNVGDKALGIYQGSERRTNNFGKEQTDYTFKNRDGAFTVSANSDLERRMTKALADGLKVGHLVEITYVKDLPAFKEGYSPMKSFKVRFDPDWKPAAKTAPVAPPPPVSDSDIPF